MAQSARDLKPMLQDKLYQTNVRCSAKKVDLVELWESSNDGLEMTRLVGLHRPDPTRAARPNVRYRPQMRSRLSAPEVVKRPRGLSQTLVQNPAGRPPTAIGQDKPVERSSGSVTNGKRRGPNLDQGGQRKRDKWKTPGP